MTLSDRYYTDILYNPRLSQGAYETYAASLRFRSPSEAFTAAVLMMNLANTIAQEWASPSVPFSAEPNKPRKYVVQLTARF